MRQAMVVVGCGGLFWHGLPRMCNFIKARGIGLVVLIDPDRIEERNSLRQWTKDAGRLKVETARDTLGAMCEGLTVSAIAGRIGDTGAEATLLTVLGEYGVERVWIVGLPDNHTARRACVELASDGGLEGVTEGIDVRLVLGGNGKEDGWAAGVIINLQDMGQDDEWWRDYPDVASVMEQAAKEDEGKARPQPCGGMVEVIDGQTAKGNMLTAVCIWDVAEMLKSGLESSRYWVREMEGRIRIWDRIRGQDKFPRDEE